MTLPHIPDPMPGDAKAADLIESVIVPRARDLGGFEVRRALPAAERQMVGPFIFFDQFGPVLMRAGQGIDVRPHPHIGLATVTWLFDGSIYHRDSLGSQQPIAPGELNWMTAGRGIVHSERTDAAELARDRQVFGIQSWVALPKAFEETAPAFEHVAMERLPLIEDRGVTVRVVAGSVFGSTSPVRTYSDLFYADVRLSAGSALPLPADHEERGIYVAEGADRDCRSVLRGRQASGVPAGRCHFRQGADRCPRSCCWVGSRWMGRAISGGTSCPPRRTRSKRPRTTGNAAALPSCRATKRTSSRCHLDQGRVRHQYPLET